MIRELVRLLQLAKENRLLVCLLMKNAGGQFWDPGTLVAE